MKRKKSLSLEDLNRRLIEVKSQIAMIEKNYANLSGGMSHSFGSFHYEPDMLGFDAASKYVISDASESALFQANYLSSKLESLIVERDALIKQIEEKEKELESRQRI